MGEISCVVIGTLPSSDLHYSLAVLSTLPDNPGDSRFWTVSPGLQIRVWNLPDNHPSFPFLVDSTFWQRNFKYFALFELFYCWHRTFPHKHQYAIVIEAIMWLVGSKPIRSNVTIPTTSFLRVFFFFSQMTSCAMHYDVIYRPFPINSQYLKTWGVDSPALVTCVFLN